MLLSISDLLPFFPYNACKTTLSNTIPKKAKKQKPLSPELYAILDATAVILALFFQLTKHYQKDSK